MRLVVSLGGAIRTLKLAAKVRFLAMYVMKTLRVRL